MIEKDLIFLNINVTNQKDCFRFLSEQLLKKHYVKPTFLEALYIREEKYPTGLEFIKGYGVAIPHVESEHCLKDCITFLKPLAPIIFQDMETGDIPINVRYIFMITLTNPDNHIDVLQSLFATISNEGFLRGLEERDNNPDSVFHYVTEWLIKT